MRKSTKKMVKRKNPVPRQQKASLIFPIGRIARYLRQGNYAPKYSEKAAIALAAVLEYIVEEILLICVETMKHHKATRIQPRHIKEAIDADEEFFNYLSKILNATIGINKKKNAKRDKNMDSTITQPK